MLRTAMNNVAFGVQIVQSLQEQWYDGYYHSHGQLPVRETLLDHPYRLPQRFEHQADVLPSWTRDGERVPQGEDVLVPRMLGVATGDAPEGFKLRVVKRFAFDISSYGDFDSDVAILLPPPSRKALR